MTTPLDEKFKNKIAAELTLRIAEAIKSGELPADQLAPICQDVLDNKDKPATYDEFIAILTELAQRWPIFNSIVEKVKSNKEAIANVDTMFQRQETQNQTVS